MEEIIIAIIEIFFAWAGINMIILMMTLYEYDTIYKKYGVKGLEDYQKAREKQYFYKLNTKISIILLPFARWVAKIFNKFYHEKALG